MTRQDAFGLAQSLSTQDGDAFLAGYYAEMRRLRMDADSKIVTKDQRK